MNHRLQDIFYSLLKYPHAGRGGKERGEEEGERKNILELWGSVGAIRSEPPQVDIHEGGQTGPLWWRGGRWEGEAVES